MSSASRHGILSSAFGEAVVSRIAADPPASPYPPAGDAAWARLDSDTRFEILAAGQEATRDPWPTLSLSQRLEFFQSGSRERFETPYFVRRRRLVAMALALALQPSDDLAAAFLDGLWSVLEETSWCVPAHETPPGGTGVRILPDPAHPVLDLFAAETGAMLAWMLAIHRDRIRDTDGLDFRITSAIDERVLTPFERNARDYHWFGLPSNWNPWVVSNLLACAFMTPPSPVRLRRILSLALESLDAYLDAVPQDGGCPEGIGYWWQSAARLFEAVELLSLGDAAAAQVVLRNPLLGRLARYPLVVHLGGQWSAVFGDGTARVPEDGDRLGRDKHPAALLWRFARAVGDDELERFALRVRGSGPRVRLPVSMQRALGSLFVADWEPSGDGRAIVWPGPKTRWLDVIQVFSATAGSNPDDLRLVAKGGTDGEPHNHLDVGSFVLARGGSPIVIDVGMGRYTASSFTSARYEQWFTTSEFHNVPEVDGVGQRPGEQYRATVSDVRVDDEHWSLSLELGAAYPVVAGIRSWRRDFTRDGTTVVMTDRWMLSREPRSVVSRLLLAGRPLEDGPDRVVLVGAGDERPLVAVEFDAASVAWHAEERPLEDPLLAAVWGPTIFRAVMNVVEPSADGLLELRFRPV